jgi:DNA invertase Pin-like site-specific DNA recombinase
MIYGYTRVSTDKQTTDNQKGVILEYAHQHKIQIDEIVEVVVSSKKKKEDRGINELMDKLKDKDTLIVYKLDRLGRSTIETLQIIEDIKEIGVRIVLISDNLVIDKNNDSAMSQMIITMLSGFAQMERTYISERTKAGMAQRKKEGVIFGRKKNSFGKSKFDEKIDNILKLNEVGLSLRGIIKQIGFGSPAGLKKYLTKLKDNNIHSKEELAKFFLNKEKNIFN